MGEGFKVGGFGIFIIVLIEAPFHFDRSLRVLPLAIVSHSVILHSELQRLRIIECFRRYSLLSNQPSECELSVSCCHDDNCVGLTILEGRESSRSPSVLTTISTSTSSRADGDVDD